MVIQYTMVRLCRGRIERATNETAQHSPLARRLVRIVINHDANLRHGALEVFANDDFIRCGTDYVERVTLDLRPRIETLRPRGTKAVLPVVVQIVVA